MSAVARPIRKETTRRELALLLLAALACVFALTAGLTGSIGQPVEGWFDAPHMVLVAFITAAGLMATVLVWRMTAQARRETFKAREESAELRSNLSAADSVIRAEPQVLVFWEPGQTFRTVNHTLTGIPGLPQNPADVLKFQQWLMGQSAAELKVALDALLADGQPFNMILKTLADAPIEAEGRAAGKRAVLRLRDVAGFKRDLAHVHDQQRQLNRDVQAARAMMNALPYPAWLRAEDGRLTWVNTAYVTAVEAAGEREVVERQIELLESRQRQMVARAVANGLEFRERLHIVVGRERKAHDVVVVTIGSATAGTAIDVTAIEKAQGELDRQITSYDRTLDRVATAVAIYNAEQRLVFFNEAFQKLWQIDAEWLGKGPSDGAVLDRLRELGRLPAVVNYRDWKTKVLAVYKSGADLEDWWHLADGRIIRVMAEQRSDGGVTYLFQDETERYQLESRYNALIDVQRETLNSLNEGVAVFATDGRLKLWNSAFAGIWKVSRRQLAENPHIDEFTAAGRVLFSDPEIWASLAANVTSFSDEREAVDGEMKRPDGSVIDYAAKPLPDGATLFTFADVTDEKKYERALEERNEALVLADKLKNQFIGHVSYELRTPLTNIIGFTDLLASPVFGSLTAKQREYLADIMSSSKTLLSIIDDILDVATIDAGAMELKREPIGVRGLIDSAIHAVRQRTIEAGLTLDIAVADDTHELMADGARVRQVLANLLSNAVGFSKPGDAINITCWRESGMVTFVVEDHGIGIPPDQQRRVFDRFVSRSQGSKHRGAGLGLSIAKSIVELHGGTLRLDSEPGEGTCVTVRLPEFGLAKPRYPDAAE